MGARGVRVAAVVAIALVLVACGRSAGPDSGGASSAPPAGTSWDLLYISDSSGWGVPQAYAELASEALDRPVRVTAWQGSGQSILDGLTMVEDRAEIVAGAEIVVLWGNPLQSGVKHGYEQCDEGMGDPGTYTIEDWAPFERDVGRTIDAIWEARGNQPTVMRVTDLYVPKFEDWKRAGIFEACREVWTLQSQAVRAAAESHGAVMVSAYDVYNGVNHDEDPAAKGWFAADGHNNEIAARAMAEALAATGFEPNRPATAPPSD